MFNSFALSDSIYPRNLLFGRHRSYGSGAGTCLKEFGTCICIHTRKHNYKSISKLYAGKILIDVELYDFDIFRSCSHKLEIALPKLCSM